MYWWWGTSFVAEFRYLRNDGSWQWTEGRGKAITVSVDGKPKLMVGTHTDISARKNAQIALKESEAKLRMLNTQLMELVKQETQKRLNKELAFTGIFEIFGTAMVITDENYFILDMNKEFCRLFGIDSKQDAIRKRFVDFLHFDYHQKSQIDLFGAIADVNCSSHTKQITGDKQMDCRFVLKNSSYIDALVSTACFKNQNDSVNFIFSLTDITSMRRLEKQQKENEQLLIGQSRMAAMGEMIGAIAHQWRQPLNLLGILVQDVPYSYQYGEISQEYIEKFSKNAMEQIYFMSKTIDDFRNFFRNDKSLKDFYLSKHVRGSLSLVSDMFRAHSIDIEITEECNPIVVGYQNELSQAILNIVANAKDELDKLGNAKKHKITINITSDSEYGIVEISDNAGGIPQEIIDRIFEPYFTTKPEGKGTGIGLYMSKTIVETNMGGRLTATNSGNGALFTIKIPLAV